MYYVCSSMYTVHVICNLDVKLCDFSFMIFNLLFLALEMKAKINLEKKVMKMKFKPHYASLLLS